LFPFLSLGTLCSYSLRHFADRAKLLPEKASKLLLIGNNTTVLRNFGMWNMWYE
jgi:hypothetical protein